VRTWSPPAFVAAVFYVVVDEGQVVEGLDQERQLEHHFGVLGDTLFGGQVVANGVGPNGSHQFGSTVSLVVQQLLQVRVYNFGLGICDMFVFILVI